MDVIRRKDTQYEWDIDHALEIGGRIFKVDYHMHYFISLRALELYDRVKGKLGESKKELILLMCFQLVLKVHTRIQMHTDDITDFIRLYSPAHANSTPGVYRQIELAIINAVGNAMHPLNCEIGEEGVVDAWQYRLPTGEAPPPLPPVIGEHEMRTFKVVVRTNKDCVILHHWDVKNIIMISESIGEEMECKFMTKMGSEIKDPAVRRVHSNFFALCRINNAMARILEVHLHANHRAVAAELDAYVVEEGSFPGGHKRLMESFRPAIESCLQTLLNDAEGIMRFVEMDGVADDREWAGMEESLVDCERKSKRLFACFHGWGWPKEEYAASHKLVGRIKAAAEKARRHRRALGAATMEAPAPVAEPAAVAVVPRRKRRCCVCESPSDQFEVEYKERGEKKAKVTSQSPQCTEKC